MLLIKKVYLYLPAGLSFLQHTTMQQNVPQMLVNEDIVKALLRPVAGMKRSYAIEEEFEPSGAGS